MKYFSTLASGVAIVSTLLAQTQAHSSFIASVSFNNTYDNVNGSLATVACGNGPNGLLSRFPTFGSLPSFPFIGGAQVVTGFGSANCGTCWELQFKGNTINVLAIDVASNGFIIPETALDDLTDGLASFFGSINATAKQVPASVCGL